MSNDNRYIHKGLATNQVMGGYTGIYEAHIKMLSCVSECSPIELQRSIRQLVRRYPSHMYHYYVSLVYRRTMFGN